MKLSIIIPVYNEEKTLLVLIQRVIDGLKILKNITEYEIVLIDDGSRDQSRQIMSGHFSSNKNFKLIYQERNQGKGAAIAKGISQSTGDIVLIQDADLEYDPQDYGILLLPFETKGADVVYGSRFKGEISRVLYFYHYLGNTFLTFLSNVFTNINLTDMETCYKVFRGPLIRAMKLESKRFGIEPEVTAKISKIKGVKIFEVPISYDGRTYEEGKKIGWKDGVSAIWCIIKFNLLRDFASSFHVEREELLHQH